MHEDTNPRADPPIEPPAGALGAILFHLARAFALAGGGVLLALGLLTVASVVGRALFAAPVSGDFELVELGGALAVFTFLPWCQLRRGNVIVDVFTLRAPRQFRRVLDTLGATLYAAIAALLAWRMALGGIDMARVGEETMVLALPLWWAFPPIVASLVLLCATALHTGWAGRTR